MIYDIIFVNEGRIKMKIFMIRHGVPDYSYGDSHGFIGHGNDLAPLDMEKIDDVIKTSKDPR